MLYRPFDYVFYFRVPDEAIRVFAVCQEAVELKKSFSFGVAELELLHETGEGVRQARLRAVLEPVPVARPLVPRLRSVQVHVRDGRVGVVRVPEGLVRVD